MATYQVEVQIKPWEEGGYLAEVPVLQGCGVVADSIGQAIKDIQEVIEMSIASRLKRGEPLPQEVITLENQEPTLIAKIAVCVP